MTKNKQRNWRRLLAACLVGVVVLGLVVAATILLTGSPDSSGSSTPAAPGISLEEWLAGSLSPKSFNGTWISGKYLIFLPRPVKYYSFSGPFGEKLRVDRARRLISPDADYFFHNKNISYRCIMENQLFWRTDIALVGPRLHLLQFQQRIFPFVDEH